MLLYLPFKLFPGILRLKFNMIKSRFDLISYFSVFRFVLALCQSGANVNLHEQRAYRTPLHFAAKCNLSACIEILLVYGALIEAVDIEEKTALSLAAESAAVESVKNLLDNGADVNVRSHRAQTPLHRAVNGLPTSQAERCVQMLLARGADPNAKDINGNTPLHLAARGRAEGSIIHQLLLYEADPSILNIMHHSVLYEYLIAFSIPDTLEVHRVTLNELESNLGFLALVESTPRSPRMIRDTEGQTIPILKEASLKSLRDKFDVEDSPESLQYMCRQVIRRAVGVAPMVYIKDVIKAIGLPPLLQGYVCSESYRNAMKAPGLVLRYKNQID